MLSICIPIYNYKVQNLVNTIIQQCKDIDILYEILLIDDCSDEEYRKENRLLSKLENVKYKELTTNIGRSKIRNLLAENAEMDYLLLMDCDVIPASSNFISKYINPAIDSILICGGVDYYLQEPDDDSYLHWHYGYNREVRPIHERIQAPYKSFVSACFLISRKLFLDIRFNEDIKGYGHEDTLFGIEIKKRNIPITHINNNVLHLGIVSTNKYIEKNKEAIRNLKFLYQKKDLQKDLLTHINILHKWKLFSKIGMKPLFVLLYYLFGSLICKNLRSKTPSLVLYDLYRLSYMFSIF